MTKRITVKLDDDVYAELLRRAGSERKISETLNPVLRQGLAAPQLRPDVLNRIESLERELAELKAEVKQQG